MFQPGLCTCGCRFPPLSIPARLALEGRETFGEYNDYRGVPVLAATQLIPLTGWGLVRKIDRAEAMEDFRRMAIAEGLAGGLLVILLGGLLMFHRRDVMTRVESRKRKSPCAFGVGSGCHGGGEPGGEIVLLNGQAEKQFGYRRDELLGQNVTSIIPKGLRNGCSRTAPAIRRRRVGAADRHGD